MAPEESKTNEELARMWDIIVSSECANGRIHVYGIVVSITNVLLASQALTLHDIPQREGIDEETW